MTNKKGTLTIEAAIVLPLFMIFFIAILYFIKGFYIQNEIESAMTKVAHEMAIHAYAIDKTGLIDLQQEAYNEAYIDYDNFTDTINNVLVNSQELLECKNQLIGELDYDFNEIKPIPMVEEDDSLIEIVRVMTQALEKAPTLLNEIYGNLLNLQKNILSLYEEAMMNGGKVATVELIEYANGIVAEQLCNMSFKRYISNKQLEAWGISYGNKIIDFGDSSLLLRDDTIEIVAKYKIEFPFFSHIINGFPIYQSVKVRGFTGSYNVTTDRQSISTKAQNEKIYFIATQSPDNYCYHYYSCLVKELNVATYQATVLKGRGLCHYCENHYGDGMDQGDKENMMVYFTSNTSKIHLSRTCPRISAIVVEAVTVNEAVARGYGKACDKYGCVGKTEGDKE
jgi:CBS domain-containing protein